MASQSVGRTGSVYAVTPIRNWVGGDGGVNRKCGAARDRPTEEATKKGWREGEFGLIKTFAHLN